MTAKEGRKKSVRVLVAVGNGKGAAGKLDVIPHGSGGGWVEAKPGPERPSCCLTFTVG
jgi:hypothetical protein